MNHLHNWKVFERLRVSPDLINILNILSRKDKVAYLLRELLFYENYADEEEINFLELSKETNKFSFMPANRRAGLSEEDKYNPNSMPTRIGRLVKKIYDKVKKNMKFKASCVVEVYQLYPGIQKGDTTCTLLTDKIDYEGPEQPYFSIGIHSNSDLASKQKSKIKIKCRGWYNQQNDLQKTTKLNFTGEVDFTNIYWTNKNTAVKMQIQVKSESLHQFIKQLREKEKFGDTIKFLFDFELTSNLIISDTDIENFVNNTIALVKKSRPSEKSQIKLVSGQDIAYWYDASNYKLESGTLGNSCMRHVEKNYFDIYCQNPEIVSMLVLTDLDEDGKEKLMARALLWKMTNGEYMLDRVYYILQSDAVLLQNWAEEKGYYYVKKDDYYKGGNKISMSEINQLIVQLDKWNFFYYPYVDNFQILDNTTGKLYVEPNNRIWDRRTLCSTEGKWQEWHDEYSEDDDDYEDYNDYED